MAVQLSDGEKLTILMLCELFEHLKIKSEFDPKFIAAAINKGHHWALDWEYTGTFRGHADKQDQTLSEVSDVLEMWDAIEGAMAGFSSGERAIVEQKADPFGKDPKFPGFDGSNEREHLSVAGFLIDDLDRFSRFRGRDLNAHAPTLETHRRMIVSYRALRREANAGFSPEQVAELLNDLVSPE